MSKYINLNIIRVLPYNDLSDLHMHHFRIYFILNRKVYLLCRKLYYILDLNAHFSMLLEFQSIPNWKVIVIIAISGCQGNDNKFITLEECVSTCGGNTPDLDTDCSAVTCDQSQILFNQAKV